MSLRDHGPTARRQPLWSMSRSASSRALALTVVALSSNVGVALTATHSETESRFVLSPFAVAEDEMLRGARLADTRHADTRHEDAALQGVGFTTNGTAPLAFVNSTMLLPPLPNQEQRLAYLILFLSMVCVLGVATLLCCAQWQPRKSLSTWLLRRRDAPIGAALSQLTRRRRMHGVLDGHAVACSLPADTLVKLLPAHDSAAIYSADAARDPITHAMLHAFVTGSFPLQLASLGIDSTDRVALLFPNGPELAVAIVAAISHVAIVPLSCDAPPKEVAYTLRTCSATCVIVFRPPDGISESLQTVMTDAAACNLLVVEATPHASADNADVGSAAVGLFSLRHSCGPVRVAANVPVPPLCAADTALLLMTSGTTGNPKAVPHTLGNVIVGCVCIASGGQLCADDVGCNVMPLFHVGGVMRGVLAPIVAGGSIVALPWFDADSFWRAIREHGATHYYASPTIHASIYEAHNARPARERCHHTLRMVVNAAGSLNHELAVQMRDAYSIDSCRCHVLPSYGMTECMPIAAPPEGYELDRVGSSGLPLGPTVQVQDAEGHALPANTHGHIVVRGRPCFGGYLPPATGQLAGQPTKPQEANTGASGKKDGGGGGQVVLVVTSFCCLNLSLSLFNKWALGDDGAAFRFPTFYTMWHMIASVLGSLTIMAASPQQRTLSCAQVRTYWWQLASLAVFFVGSLVFNAASLVYIGLSVNQILRACSPLPQLLFSYGIEGKVPSVRLCLIVLTLCTFGALSIPIGALTATSFGLTFALAGVLLLAAKVSTSSVLMKDAKKSGLTPVALVFYDSSLSFIGCLAMWLLNRDERDASLEYLRADPQRAALVIVTGSTMAMLYNVVSFTLTKRTSSVTSSILGATLKITLIAVSAVMEGGHSVANWIATILFFVVLLSYVYDRMGNWRAGKEAYVESAGDSAHNSLMNSVRTDTDGAWFDTGDEGHLDSDGYLYITGRTKEMINRGGETIAPGQIEEALASHPAVAEVAAFSTPHTTLSEAVGVCVVLQPGSARVSLRELTGHCASLLAPSRWPWLVVYAPSLPRTRGRKVVRRGLAERMALPLLGDEDPEAERTFEVLSDAEMSGSTPIPTRRVEALPTNPAGDDSPSETDLDGPTVEWTPAERSVLSAWRQLRMSGGVPAAEAGAGLDDDLRLAGGTSIQLGLLASTLSQQHGVTIRPIALFSPPRSVRSIAAALEKMSSTQHSTCERAAGRSDTSGGAMGNTTTNNGDDSAPGRASAQMSCLALVVQGLPYALFESTYQITGLMLRSFVLVASPISLHGKHYYGASSPLLTTLRVALALVASRRLLLDIVLPLLGVAIKWTVLGRLREGRYPLWGGVYLRWWFADRALKWCGKGALFTMNGVWHRTYLRMLGATIGNGAALSPDAILTEPDLLAFGKDAAVDAGAIISPFVADNGAMVAKRITIGEGCTICANATVAPGASLLPGAVLPVLSSSHDQPPSEAERCEFQKLCRSRFTLPARWRRWLIGNPTLLLVQIVAYIPQLFVLHWLVIPSKQHHASHDAYASNFHVEPDAPFGVRFGSRLAWLALPERQLALLVSAAVAHVFGPIFHFAAAVVVKRVLIGKFSEGPRTEWARFQFWLMNEMVDKQLCGVHALFGFYWGATTLAMKALGAHVGKRIFWPHTMPKIVEFDLLTVGDDVTFGSRSTIFASDNQRLAHVTLGAGSMISDRCCLLPGSSVGRNGVLGSGTLAEQDRHYGADCLTIGAADGRCIVLNEGSTSTPPVPRIPEAGDVDTFSPFARTFHGSNVVMPGREPRPSQTATYWVPPRAMIALFAAAVSPLEPMLRSSNMLAVLLMLRWLDGFSEGNLVMNPHARMAFVATVFGFLTFYRVSVLPLYTAILVAVSRARDSFDNPDHANLDWDQSTYLLRRKMIEYLPTGKGELEKLGGSAYIVGYYRLLNAKIGRDVCLFPAGCHDGLLPTEPAQVEIGDRVCVNRSSLVGHLNTRGHFVIGRLNLGSRSTLRDFTRVMGGSVLAPRSRLLEHTLLMAGESSTRGETLQGWPTRDSLPDSHVHDAEEEEACVGEEKASDEFAFGLLGGTAQPDEYKDKASEREHSNVRVLKWRTCILLGLLVPSLVIGVAMAQLVSTSLAHNLAQHAEPGPVAAEPGPVAQQAEPGPPSAQLLLHVPSRADHAFLVATVETRSDARSFPMDGAHGIDFLNVNPPGKSWDGFQAKTEGYVAWLDSEIERSGGEQIALVADADDVMYGGCGHAEIMQRYRAIVERSGGARVVFGAQFRVYPSYAQRYVASYYHSPAILARKAAVQQLVGTDDSSYAPWLNETECALDFDGHAQKHIDRWDSCPQPHAYACLNSGLVMGPLSDLRAVFHGMLSMPSKSSHAYDRGQIRYTDQMAAHSYAAEHASNVTLDYTGSLFGDLVHMNAPSTAPTAMYYVEGRGREATVHNAVTNTTQCFLHGNGNERIKAMWARVNSEMGASCQPRFEGDKRCSGSELAPM